MTQVEGAKVHPSHKPITMVLLGTNSSNKCLIGNAILRQHCFAAGPAMIQLLDNTSVRIINTPDNLSEQEATSKEELSPSYPDPRLFLLVLEDNKLSQEEIKIFDYLKERFGKNIVEYTIVVKVSGEEESSATPADENLKKVLNECEEQISVRKNEDVKESDLMKQLMEKWDKIQKRLEPSIYEDLYEDIDTYQTNESTEQGEDPKVQQPHKDISMVLLGLKNNTCMTGNAILQEDWFGAGKERHPKVKQVEDRRIWVIDAPDNLHWPIPQPEELKPSYSHPRLFLLVLQDNKLSQEEIKMFDDFKGRFGEKMVENTIVVLVRGEEERSGEPNERADNSLEKILDECGKRVCVLKKNQDMKESELMKQLLEIRDKMEANSSASKEHVYEVVDYIGVMNTKQTDESNVISGEIARPPADITVVLLGKNNDDKCLIGNIILREKRFKSEDCETNTGKAEDQSVLLIKTSDSLNPKAHAIEEIQPSYTGPRVFLLILQGHKVSQEETEMFNRLKKTFGEPIVKNTILLVDSEKPLLENSIYTEKLLTECENKVCCYNKDVTENKLVEELMKYTMGIMERDQASKPAGERYNSLRFPPVNFNGPYENCFPLKSRVEPTPNMSEVLVHQEHSLDRLIASFTTIVLLGQTGSGKSATGNTILGKQYFESHASSVPVTQECQKEEGKVCGVKIRVVDTPDFFNEDLKNKEEKLRLCKDLIQQGPVVYLLVMEIGRFTDGEREVLPHLKKEFGEDMTAKTVILFTNKEKLTGKTLKDYINETDEELQKLIGTCHSRCCAFNNNKKSSQQVKELMDVILNMQTHGNMTMKPQRNALDKRHSKCRIM